MKKLLLVAAILYGSVLSFGDAKIMKVLEN